ncbi:MAG: class I SAM-dependent methyltransferase [Verrucomicrobia bacterium]|nr:class I SAM-dependent methyltransferase [Verrucomicrobiota bacterium]
MLNKLPGRGSNYIAECLAKDPSSAKTVALKPHVLNTFQDRWRALLPGTDVSALRVMEPACGSANDYRFMHAFGFGHLMQYRGFDICAKNIANAHGLLPDVSFEEGSVFDIRAQDQEVDYLYVHDLFEHLSLNGMERGLDEVCRVTRGTACLCFFNMSERSDHLVQPKDGYHWNRLSLEKVCQFLEPRCQQLQIIHVSSFLNQAFGCDDYHNQGAYALVLDFGVK